MAKTLLSVRDTIQGAVPCLLHNILDNFGIQQSVEEIEAALCIDEWTSARINRAAELGHPAVSVFSPVSILGEEIRFLLGHGLNARYIDPFNPYAFAHHGLPYLSEYRSAQSGMSMSQSLVFRELGDTLEVWQARVDQQLADYSEAGDRMQYEERPAEYGELVQAVQAGAVVRMPMYRTAWKTEPAMAYDVTTNGELVLHLPGSYEVTSIVFPESVMSSESWQPQSGAVIYWLG